MPPVLFDELVREYLDDDERLTLNTVLEQKAEGAEKDNYQIPAVPWESTNATFESLRRVDIENAKHSGNEEFDFIFRMMVM